ncbi:MAG: hypothetical protein WD359_05500 [Dehalococcoidia bacterium]
MADELELRPEYVFTGRLTPENRFLLVDLPELIVQTPELRFSVDIKVKDSRITATVRPDVGRGTPRVSTLRDSVADCARVAVDVLGFYQGAAYYVHLEEVTGAVTERFDSRLGDLRELLVDSGVSEPEIWELASRHGALRQSLSDLRTSILSPTDTPYSTFRAIESIRQYFVDRADADEQRARRISWDRMRAALQLERWRQGESWSKDARHGDEVYLSYDERLAALRFAWSAVLRFCVFLRMGRDLSAGDYPLISD